MVDDNNIINLNREFWLICPCGLTSWMIGVGKPKFDKLVSVVYENCELPFPIEFQKNPVKKEDKDAEKKESDT